ncbi:MAG TPA: DUF4340 domain-containing protein [bacterium]
MRFRNTYILAGITMLVAAYIAVVEVHLKKKGESAAEKAKKVFNFDESAVRSITISGAGGEILLTKVGVDRWLISKPLNTGADEQTVKSLITSIMELERKREIPEKLQGKSLYGFDKPQGEITVETETATFSLIVGNINPVSDALYIKKPDEDKIILSLRGVDSYLSKSVNDFRDKRVLRFKSDEVETISISGGRQHILVQKKQDGWWIVDPVNVMASNEEINRLFSALDGLRTDSFVDDKPRNLNVYGLNKPQASLTLLLKNKGILVFSIGKLNDKKTGIYAMRSGDSSVYLVRKSILEDIVKDLNDLRERRLFSIKPDDVKKIELDRFGEKVLFEKDNNGEWSVNGLRGKNYEIEELIRKLKDLKAEKFLDKNKKLINVSGLTNAGIVVRILIKGSKDPLMLEIGNDSGNDVYASNPGKPWIVTVNKSIKDFLLNPVSYFQEEKKQNLKE